MIVKACRTEDINTCIDSLMHILMHPSKQYGDDRNFFVPFVTGKYDGLILPQKNGNGFRIEILVDKIENEESEAV